MVGAPDQQAADVLDVFYSGFKPATAEQYRDDMAGFAAFCGETDARAAVARLLGGNCGAAHAVVERFRNACRDAVAPTTTNRRLSTIRSLVTTANRMDVVPWTLNVRGLRTVPYRNTHGPGREVVRQMLAAAEGRRDESGYRDVAIVRLFWDLALRRAEAAGLDAEHVDLRRGRLSILGKGRLQREWLKMPLLLTDAMTRWIAARGTEPGPLLASFHHARRPRLELDGQTGGVRFSRLDGSGLYWLVRQMGEAVGAKVTPHGIRHSAVTEFYRRCKDLVKTRKFSRHKSIQTLQYYLDNAEEDVSDIAEEVSASVDMRVTNAKG